MSIDSSRLTKSFISYAEYHQTPGNKATHLVGIPMIMLSTFGLLSQVSYGKFVDLGSLLLVLASLFVIRMDSKRGVPFSLVSLAMYAASLLISWPVHLGFFISGWILQGIGHYHYEKRSPAFLTNLEHLVVGPFWIYCFLTNQLKEEESFKLVSKKHP